MIIERPDVTKLVLELLSLPRDKKVLANSKALRDLRDILKPFLDSHSDLSMFIIGPDGINIGSMRDENLAEINFFAGYGNYLDKMLTGKPQLVLPLRSDVFLPDTTGKLAKGQPTMFIGVPIKVSGGAIVAAFTIRINPILDFTQIISMSRIGLTGDSYAFNNNGYFISQTPSDFSLRINPLQNVLSNLLT